MKLEEMDAEAYKIVGVAMRVHQELGCGFLESVYGDALEIEFQKQGIPYTREQFVFVYYSGVKLRSFFKTDYVCYENMIVELKATSELTSVDSAQTMNYMKATHSLRALLINFGEMSLRHKYLTWQAKWNECREVSLDCDGYIFSPMPELSTPESVDSE